MKNNNNDDERRNKVPRWVENRKATHAKIREIPLG